LGPLADPQVRIENSRRVRALAAQTDGDLYELSAQSLLVQDLLELGAVEEAASQITMYQPRATRVRDPYDQWAASIKQALLLTLHGDFDAADELIEGNRRYYERFAPGQANSAALVQRFPILRERGELASLEAALRDVIDRYWPALEWFLPLFHAETDEPGLAREELDELLLATDRLPAYWRIASLAIAAEAAAELGPPAHLQARALHRELLPFAGRHIVGGGCVLALGPVDYYLGRLAITGGDAERAVPWLESALAALRRYPAPALAARAERALNQARGQRNGHDAGLAEMA
jgi:hypothetical protein